MTIAIPAWLLWALGVLGGIVVLALAVLGVAFIWVMHGFGRGMDRAFGYGERRNRWWRP